MAYRVYGGGNSSLPILAQASGLQSLESGALLFETWEQVSVHAGKEHLKDPQMNCRTSKLPASSLRSTPQSITA